MKLSKKNFQYLLPVLVIYAFFIAPLPANAETPFLRQFNQATSAPHLERFGIDGPIRWETNDLLIGFFVPGRKYREAFEQINETFEADAVKLEKELGIRVSVATWWDNHPTPNIFVLLGEPSDIARLSSVVEQRFGVPGFAEEIRNRVRTNRSLCLPVEVFLEGQLSAMVLIVNLKDDPEYCVRRSLIHSLGLVGTLNAGEESILARDSQIDEITELDLKLLRKLYQRD